MTQLAGEELLLISCQQKKADALQELCSRYGSSLYRFTCTYMGKADRVVGQVMAAALVHAIQHPPAIPLQNSLLAHLMQSLWEHLRTLSETPVDPAYLSNFDIKQGIILKGLKSLNKTQRAMILLRDQLDLTMPELTQIFSLPEKVIKDKLSQARLLLRDQVHLILENQMRQS